MNEHIRINPKGTPFCDHKTCKEYGNLALCYLPDLHMCCGLYGERLNEVILREGERLEHDLSDRTLRENRGLGQ